MKQSRSGFTLIELIFVIVIIGLLAAVAVPRFLTTEQNAKIKPALEVGNQIKNKVTERWHEIQDDSILDAINSSQHIKNYLHNATHNVDKHFNWDANETLFELAYDPNKKTTGNSNDTNDTDTNVTGQWCVKVYRVTDTIPVTADSNTTGYDYQIDVNASCISAAD